MPMMPQALQQALGDVRQQAEPALAQAMDSGRQAAGRAGVQAVNRAAATAPVSNAMQAGGRTTSRAITNWAGNSPGVLRGVAAIGGQGALHGATQGTPLAAFGQGAMQGSMNADVHRAGLANMHVGGPSLGTLTGLLTAVGHNYGRRAAPTINQSVDNLFGVRRASDRRSTMQGDNKQAELDILASTFALGGALVRSPEGVAGIDKIAAQAKAAGWDDDTIKKARLMVQKAPTICGILQRCSEAKMASADAVALVKQAAATNTKVAAELLALNSK